MLTADDVLNAKFQATLFRAGYDQGEVDTFLDRVVATLRAGDGGPAASDPVTAQQVTDQRFTTTKRREGYDQAEVDALLDRVVAALGGASVPGRAVDAPAHAEPAVASAVTERRGWFGRRRR